MAKKIKTNVMRLLQAAKIPYEVKEYDVDENDLSGLHVAKQLGQPVEKVFKTLVLRGEKNGWDAAPNPGRNLRFRHLPFSLSRSDKGRIKLRLRIECTEKIHETYSFIFDFHFAGDGRIGGGRADRCDGRGARRV